jgi:hypothetical protein
MFVVDLFVNQSYKLEIFILFIYFISLINSVSSRATTATPRILTSYLDFDLRSLTRDNPQFE